MIGEERRSVRLVRFPRQGCENVISYAAAVVSFSNGFVCFTVDADSPTETTLHVPRNGVLELTIGPPRLASRD